ncbi:MAG: EamA family transporter [Bacteroidetes bacterium]|nr:EamA family transporter [Bacteroidota bacterium]
MSTDDTGNTSSKIIKHALGWMILSTLFFSLVMVTIKLFLIDLPPEQTVFLRYFVGTVMIVPLVWRSTMMMFTSSERWRLWLRALLHGVGVFSWFFGILRIPLAEVNAMLNMGPVYAAIGAALFMGERLRIRRIAAIIVSFIGALIIIKPGFAEVNFGTLAVVIAAPLFAGSDLLAKHLKKVHEDNFIIFALSFGISALLLIPAIWVWQPMNAVHWGGVLAISLFATLGHVGLMRAFRGPMWAAQTGKYMQLIFVVGFGIALFDEIPLVSTIVGAFVVLAAVSYIAFREGRARKLQS